MRQRRWFRTDKALIRAPAFILAEGREQRGRFLARMHERQAVTDAGYDAQLRMPGEMVQFGGVLHRNEWAGIRQHD
jgi:hypothetical protein